MVDEKLIEEIVRRVLEALQAEGKACGDQCCGRCDATPAEAPKPGTSHSGRVLSEWDVLTAHRSGKGWLGIGRKTIVTPLARERAKDLGVELVIRE